MNLGKPTSILDKNFILNYYYPIRLLIKKILNPKHSLRKGAPVYPVNLAYSINDDSRLCLSKTIPACRFMLKQIPRLFVIEWL